MPVINPSQWSASLSQTLNQLLVNGQDYWVQNGAQSWSLTAPSANTLRFEVRPGDVWTLGDTSVRERSEIAGVTNYANGTEVDLHYGFQLEPGAANTAAWTVVGQLHQDAAVGGSPPFGVYMVGEQMAVEVGFTNATGSQVQETVYLDPTPIQRGHVYDIKVAATFDPKGNGSLVVWRDGVEIVNYHGALGYVGETSTYFKEGIYRAAATETLAADYSNLSATTAAGLTQTGTALGPQLTLNQVLTNDTGASNSDLVSSQGAVGLSGVATNTLAVTVHDGATVLGTTQVDSTGHWTWYGTLGQGTHALTASAVSSSGATTTTAAAPAIVIDQTAPVAPTVTGVVGDTGRSSSDFVTSSHKLALTGVAEAGSTVRVYLNGAALGSTAVDGSGHWTYSSSTPVADGSYNIIATSTDTAGNTSSNSANVLLKIDDTAPVTSISNVQVAATGVVLNGLSRAAAMITVSAAGVAPVAAVAASNTVWSAALPNAGVLSVITYTVSTVDLAGNAGAAFHVVIGTGAADTLNSTAAGDVLFGGGGNDLFVLRAGTVDHTDVLDLWSGDSITFRGYDPATRGVVQVDSSHWRVSDATHSEVLTLGGGSVLHNWSFS